MAFCMGGMHVSVGVQFATARERKQIYSCVLMSHTSCKNMHVLLDSSVGQQCVLVLSILQHLLSAERSFDVHALHAWGTHIRSV